MCNLPDSDLSKNDTARLVGGLMMAAAVAIAMAATGTRQQWRPGKTRQRNDHVNSLHVRLSVAHSLHSLTEQQR